ncbi:MAG: MTH938/NDUFAF3 family protein, partial [Gammaproteobacteria bacterium]
VIVLPESVRDQWWRKEGHSLHTEDLTAVVDAKPDLVILGTGYYGNMTIPATTRNFLESKGIEVRVAKTGQAVEEFNALQQQYARVVAALHLTC